MIVLDTNIFIYLAKGALAKEIIQNQTISHASITEVEALGYSQIPANELLLLSDLFDASNSISLSDKIIKKAIELRQAKRMSLSDAIIAASALDGNHELWTANTKDFDHIDGLQLYNPFEV